MDIAAPRKGKERTRMKFRLDSWANLVSRLLVSVDLLDEWHGKREDVGRGQSSLAEGSRKRLVKEVSKWEARHKRNYV